MGEAGVHRRIEMIAWGVKELELMKKENADKGSADLSVEQKLAYETYAGNWMRDFSQVFVPKLVIEILGKFPSNISMKRALNKGDFFGDPVGSDGAETILTGFLRTLAVLELGEDIGKRLVTPENLGAYRADEHIDNPAGYTLHADLLIKTKKSVKKNDKTVTKEVFDRADAVDRGKQLDSIGGKGFSGTLQIEEPVLYEINRNGLALHINNSTEMVKGNFIEAVDANDESKRRILFGRGLHAIEDYFAHSNYIEVLLNIVLQDPDDFGISSDSPLRKPPKHENPFLSRNRQVIDTLFEIPVQNPSPAPKPNEKEVVKTASLRRQAITTGTFGFEDTLVSIIHVVVASYDALIHSIDRSLDELLDLAESGQDASINKLKEKKESKRRAEALDLLITGFDEAGVTIPFLVIKVRKLKDILKEKDIDIPLPDSIANLDIPVDLPDEEQVPLKTALDEVLRFLRAAKNAIMKALPKVVIDALELTKKIKALRDRIKLEVKIQIIRFLLFITSTSPERAKQIKREKLEEFAKFPGNFIKFLLDSIIPIEPGTSIESRLKKDLKDKESDGKIVPKHNPIELLPPSHSEICKDHPPSLHGSGSPFFALHTELAVEAVRHFTTLMHDAWSDKNTKVSTGSIPLPVHPVKELDDEAVKVAELSRRNLGAGETANNSSAVSMAKKHSVIPNFRQLDTGERTKKLLNAVDLYISHPLDTRFWWLSIVKNHLSQAKAPDRIANDIDLRNQTRKNRS